MPLNSQRETAAREMLRRFAHVPIDEDGWLVSDDKLLKKDEVKVDETQSAPARGVVLLSESVSSWPFRGHAHRSLGTLVSCARISRVMAWSLNKRTGDMFLVWSKVEALWSYAQAHAWLPCRNRIAG